jgi:hypothetical protein
MANPILNDGMLPMSDEWITVASFSVPLAAQIAMGRLQDDGIEVFSTGELSAAPFAGVSALGGTVQLQVRAYDAHRARGILAECEELAHSDWESQAEPEDIWVCSLCGEPVSNTFGVCPSCQTSRDAIRSADAATTRLSRIAPSPDEDNGARQEQVTTAPPPLRDEEFTEEVPEIPNLDTFLADDLARRAFRAALFGIMSTVFLFNLYSLWLSLRLCLMPGELTPKSSSRLRWAVLLNIIVVLAWVIALEFLRYAF